MAFVQNGQADLAMLDPFETINAVNAGADINIVYEVMQNAPEGIAVAEGSDAQSVADLVGTTVGLVSDRDRAFLQAALNTVGPSIDEVDTVVLGESGPTLAAAVRDGNVSAISGAAPDWIALIANGIKMRLITPEELLASPANNFVTNAGDPGGEARGDGGLPARLVEGHVRGHASTPRWWPRCCARPSPRSGRTRTPASSSSTCRSA